MAICLRPPNSDPLRAADGSCVAFKTHSPLIAGVNIYFWGEATYFTFTWVTTTPYPAQEVVMLTKLPLGVFLPRQKWARDLGAGTSHLGLAPGQRYQVLVRAETATEFSQWQEFYVFIDPDWNSDSELVYHRYSPVYHLADEVYVNP